LRRKGKLRLGKLVYLPKAVLTESVPGRLYEIHIRAERPVPEARVVERLWTELPRRVRRLEVTACEADKQEIILQIKGSPFPWAAVLAALPAILAVLGIVILFIAVFVVMAHVPGWAYALVAAGLLALFVLPRYVPKPPTAR